MFKFKYTWFKGRKVCISISIPGLKKMCKCAYMYAYAYKYYSYYNSFN